MVPSLPKESSPFEVCWPSANVLSSILECVVLLVSHDRLPNSPEAGGSVDSKPEISSLREMLTKYLSLR
jgi:hypothetical protein